MTPKSRATREVREFRAGRWRWLRLPDDVMGGPSLANTLRAWRRHSSEPEGNARHRSPS